jgi:hypothetical protein
MVFLSESDHAYSMHVLQDVLQRGEVETGEVHSPAQ